VAVILGLSVLSLAQQQPRRQLTDEVSLRIIIVNSLDEAEQVVQQLARGDNFVALARRVSIDPSADKGGLIGRMALSGLRPELRAALQDLAVGHISPVIRVPTGFAVLKIVPDTDLSESRDVTGRPGPSVSAAGAVKYTVDVAGFGESITAATIFSKPADWNQSPRTICDVRTQSLADVQNSLQADLASPRAASALPLDVIQLITVLGQTYAYRGKMDQAIDAFEKAHRMARTQVPAAAIQLEEMLGIAYLHRSEMANDVYRRPGDRDLLSAKGLPGFARTGDSEKAIDHFLQYLREKPDELEVKWLLNVAYMTAGGYPSRVPPAHLIPPSAFKSTDSVGRFLDVAPQAGLTSFSSAGGVIVDDFDNDGRLDVVTSSFNACESMHFFHRNADGSFADRAEPAGLAEQLGGGLNMLQADFDNNGCLDILLLRGGWEMAQRKSLLRNNCDGTFTDVTAASGLAQPATSTQTAAWADINNDGYLDVFVGNEESPAQLFLNQGDGTFKDVASTAGVDRTAFTKGVTAGDFDNDGWPDLYVSNMGGGNFLYRNNHDATFTELANAAGVPGAGQGFATWFFDYDNDGRPDLFVTSYFTSVDESARTYLGLPHNADTLKLYRNLGDGSFQDVTRQVGLDKVFMPMGANFGDIDNDGFLDIYLGTGNPSYASLIPSVLLHNRNGQSFTDVTESSGTGELHKGHGVAFADLDNDGNDEIVFEVGGATPGDAHALRLFHNPGQGNDWINLRLIGVKTNRAAIGARITVTVDDGGQGTRRIHRTVGSGGSFGASPLPQHIGLGKSAGSVSIEIWWPTSNTRQRFADVGKNRSIEIKEFGQDHTVLNRPALSLGAAAAEAREHVQ
jgi:tetratricopeptide (TPR) repeat protein